MMISYSVVKIIHIVSAILMAWPFYALVIVNQRVRLGPPLGDRLDIYMETIIRNRAIPCFIFQATAFVSGLVMILLSAHNLSPLIQNLILGIKFGLLLLISSLLTYVHFWLQPRLDGLFIQLGTTPSPEVTSHIGRLRLRRKRLASICLFSVLTISMLGVQTWKPFPWWLTASLVVAIAAFTYRAYKSVSTY